MKERVIRRRRIEILLGIIFLVIAVLISTVKKKAHQALVSLERTNDPYLSYAAWIAEHQPEYQNSGDAQYAYYKYAEELQTNLKVCSFFCANFVETFSKIGKSSNVSL